MGGKTDDSSGLYWSASVLWVTKYGAARAAGRLFQGLACLADGGVA